MSALGGVPCGVYLPGGLYLPGVYLLGGVPSGEGLYWGVPGIPTPSPRRDMRPGIHPREQTDACENITFLIRWRVENICIMWNKPTSSLMAPNLIRLFGRGSLRIVPIRPEHVNN